MIRYLSEEHLESIFELLAHRYARQEEIPYYRYERDGIAQLHGVLQQVQSNFYSTLIEKAAYILISINKGHFFSNGNKRLALVTTIAFLGVNGYQLRDIDKQRYKELLTGYFPEYNQWEDFKEFTSSDFATYNLSIAIADNGVHNISHDELKRRVQSFLKNSIEQFSK